MVGMLVQQQLMLYQTQAEVAAELDRNKEELAALVLSLFLLFVQQHLQLDLLQ
jgi:hypothetical protein